MRKDTDHLTPPQRRQLERAVVILREEFAKAIRGKGWTRTRQGRILKIILFGSMARGKPVRDLATGYRSDFDLLVVVSHPELTDDEWWYGAKDGLNLEQSLGSGRYPYSIFVHDLQDVNDQLHRGRPFFVDINRDGIIAYEFEPKELAKPGNLSAREKLDEAREHFEQWFESSLEFLKVAKICVNEKLPKKAAFLLHQAVETGYHSLLLTLTLYSPKLHNIETLRGIAEGLDSRLIEAWPRKTRSERRAFNHIKRAYVEARYSKHYRITKELLDEATISIEKLQALVKILCEERLKQR